MQKPKRKTFRLRLSQKFACTLLSAVLFCTLSLLCAGDIIRLFSTDMADPSEPVTLLSYPQSFSDYVTAEPEIPESKAPETPQVAPAPSAQTTPTVKDGELPLQTVSLSPITDKGYLLWNSIHMVNQTNYSIDLAKLMKQSLKLKAKKSGKPEVLIIHTHTTEGFSEKGAASYSALEVNRSEDPAKNVVAVGDEFARVLKENGIEAIHDPTINDMPDFNSAYTKSAKLVESILKKYPSIRVVVDIHRDSIVTAEGVKYRPITTLNSGNAAQAMFVIGTDANGKSHKNWKENLKFALKWIESIEKSAPGLTRPLLISRNRYNEHFTTGSVILEIGTAGNCVEEAKLSASMCASSLAKLLKG